MHICQTCGGAVSFEFLKTANDKLVRATYLGTQWDGVGGGFELYNLLDPLPGHPVGSTVSVQTVRESFVPEARFNNVYVGEFELLGTRQKGHTT